MLYVLEENDRELVKIGILCFVFYIFYLGKILYVLKQQVIGTQTLQINRFAIPTKDFKQSEYWTINYFNINSSIIMTTIPLERRWKAKWFQNYRKNCFNLNSKSFKSIIVGDSLIAGLNRYCTIKNNFFRPTETLNCVIRGDKVHNVSWSIKNLPVFCSWKNAIILWDTNNLHQDSPEDIVHGIIKVGHRFKRRHHHVKDFICRLLFRDEFTPLNLLYIIETNKH